MLCKKTKKAAALFLAFCLSITALQIMPQQAIAAEAVNLALSATATASNSESNTNFTPDKLNDGDRDSKWSTDAENTTRTVTLSWNTAQTVKSFSILWERRTAQNLTIETSLTGAEGSWTQAYTRTAIPNEREEKITLENTVNAQYIRFSMSNILGHCVDDAEGFNWTNVSIYELEVFADSLPDTRSEAQKIVDSIQAPAPGASDANIPMPTVPTGTSVRFCADYEQIIAEDGTIYHPLETKIVKGFYEVTCPNSDDEPEGSEARTAEFTITVPGKHTTSGGTNEKPSVIPELQEWHAGTGNFLAKADGRIIVEDRTLSDVAKLFAEDYKEIMGVDISVVDKSSANVSAKAGDFILSLAAESEGLDKEGYTLDIQDTVSIQAEQATGAYWATRTLLQILKQTNGSIPKGLVRDYPKYEVRAFSLDVGRKPFTLETLYEFMENMAWYKMNSLQVHISDNLIFLEDYPNEETAIKEAYAGFRLESTVKGEQTNKSATSEDVYYTKNEFRQFVKDSRARGVGIVPEFDMPAHALPFTKAFTEIMSTNTIQGQGRYRIDELDLTKMDKTMDIVKNIWNEYFEGPDPVFDQDTIIHIGTDEYHGVAGQQGIEYFREFSDKMIEFVQSTGRTVRMWGSLSNKAGATPVRSKDVQLNIWNTGYANPKNMYDMGFDLINTLEGPNYIVPAAGYYNDYINADNIYTNWQPNNFNNFVVSAGDDQMLGACYAVWHDSVDTRGNGISQYDSFDRFFQPLPCYGAKLWGEGTDRNYTELSKLFAKTGTAPGTTIYGETDTISSTIADYQFDEALDKDASPNNYDLTNVQNAEKTDTNTLLLKGGKSYVETPLNQIGSNASLNMKVKMDANASGEQILCESKDAFGIYGTYAFKAVQKGTGKVGFSREGYHYSFDYTLPKNQWIELEFRSGKDSVALYVNGTMVDDNPDIYFENHPDTELSGKLSQERITKIATMLAPLGRIGSMTNSFKGEIDYVTVTAPMKVSGEYGRLDRNNWTTSACSTSSKEGSQAGTLDDNPSTYWHQDYDTDTTNGTTTALHPEGGHWFELTLPNPETVATLTYLPRQNHTNGRVLEYSIVVTTPDGTKKTVVDHQRWANDTSLKSAVFEPITAKKVRLVMHSTGANHATIAELNLYKGVTLANMKLSLQNALDNCSYYNETDYTVISWNSFQNAKNMAQLLMESNSAIVEDYISAYELLEKTAQQLIPASDDASNLLAISRNKLTAAVNGKKELLAQINEADYTQTSVQALKDAIDNAEKELAKADATKDSLDAIFRTLTTTTLEKQEDPALVASRDRLTAAVREKKDLLAQINEADYTEASVQALKDAIDNAEKELAKNDATKDSLDAMTDALNHVRLVTKAEVTKKTELLNAINAAEEKELKDTRYTSESLKTLKTAIEEAKVLLETDATVEELQAALDKLADAKQHLKFKTYKVTFNSNGGSAVAAKTVTIGQKVTAPANPKRNGYQFSGWYTTAACTVKYNFTSAVTKDLTLYAKWTKIPAPNPFKDGAKMTDKKTKITYKVIKASKKTVMVVKGGNKNAKSVTIPSYVTIYNKKCKVVTIGKNAFKNYHKMTKATIGSNIATIDKNAFAGCKKLKNITLKGKSLKTVNNGAFKGTAKNLTFKTKGLKKAQKNKLLRTLKKGGNKKIKIK